jgi:hypothetical protein
MNKQEEYNNDNESNNSLGNTSNSDNCNENGKREKKTRNRPSKAERFVEEREVLIKELEKMMGLTKEVRGVLLYDLEHNEELKSYLKNKIPEIRKLYKCGTWNYFVKQHTEEGEELSEICLLKSIFKSEKYELISKMKYAEKNGEKKKYSNIYFFKDLNINQYFK